MINHLVPKLEDLDSAFRSWTVYHAFCTAFVAHSRFVLCRGQQTIRRQGNAWSLHVLFIVVEQCYFMEKSSN